MIKNCIEFGGKRLKWWTNIVNVNVNITKLQYRVNVKNSWSMIFERSCRSGIRRFKQTWSCLSDFTPLAPETRGVSAPPLWIKYWWKRTLSVDHPNQKQDHRFSLCFLLSTSEDKQHFKDDTASVALACSCVSRHWSSMHEEETWLALFSPSEILHWFVCGEGSLWTD